MKDQDCIIVLDFGSQYAQLITRRIREHHVFCEYFAWDADPVSIMSLKPKGFILSGGPNSIYDPGAPMLPQFIIESGLPILGICYGMHALANILQGEVKALPFREYGKTSIRVLSPNPLLPCQDQVVCMSHGDQVATLPPGFVSLAESVSCTFAAIGNESKQYYALQFHPEVIHTELGRQILGNFAFTICQCQPTWVPGSIIDSAVKQIQGRVAGQPVLATISGGVDSSVATALARLAVGSNLKAMFVDTGLLREGESQQVEATFRPLLGDNLLVIDASAEFFTNLAGIIDPEEKRRIIGNTFIRVFEHTAAKLGELKFLVQGTIYPDVIESRAPERNHAQRIKSHHNVAGLPPDMLFELVEPLRYLFKDEVRAIGKELGLPYEIIWRQPFPGPGLAVRCLGEITPGRIAILRQCDAIFLQELHSAGFLSNRQSSSTDLQVSQAFAVLLPIRSVGVMGDQRTYQEVVALRAVITDDFMTADWAQLPNQLLAKVSNRLINEVNGINRVVYDITSKPPATIEWE